MQEQEEDLAKNKFGSTQRHARNFGKRRKAVGCCRFYESCAPLASTSAFPFDCFGWRKNTGED